MIQSGTVSIVNSPFMNHIREHPDPPIVAEGRGNKHPSMQAYVRTVRQTFSGVPRGAGWYMRINLSGEAIEYIQVGQSKNLYERLTKAFGAEWIALWSSVYGDQLIITESQKYRLRYGNPIQFDNDIRRDVSRSNTSHVVWCSKRGVLPDELA